MLAGEPRVTRLLNRRGLRFGERDDSADQLRARAGEAPVLAGLSAALMPGVVVTLPQAIFFHSRISSAQANGAGVE